MNPLSFPEQTGCAAEDQPEYRPLPIHTVNDSATGSLVVTSCWGMSWPERLRCLFTGRVWVQQLSFRDGINPQLLSVERPAELQAWLRKS
jgi:hypothetical protein